MSQKEPPFPPTARGDGKPSTRDGRTEFEGLSESTPRPPDLERAFLRNRIALIENNLQLSDSEKQEAIAGIRRRLAVLRSDT